MAVTVTPLKLGVSPGGTGSASPSNGTPTGTWGVKLTGPIGELYPQLQATGAIHDTAPCNLIAAEFATAGEAEEYATDVRADLDVWRRGVTAWRRDREGASA